MYLAKKQQRSSVYLAKNMSVNGEESLVCNGYRGMRTEEEAGGSSLIGRTKGHVEREREESVLDSSGLLQISYHHTTNYLSGKIMCRPSWFLCFPNLSIHLMRTSRQLYLQNISQTYSFCLLCY